ncbi:sensor histidine kinase [Specibacter sp. NPDC057265]|uniref:sensor histidine kinase n=1 Tax=Specibacter sp. NPDC057265 TaxID=3346075 RepID=UPI00364472E9
MKKSKTAFASVLGGNQLADRISVLKLGPSPFPLWISILIAVFITVSAVDDVRLFTTPDRAQYWLAISCTVAYWLLWLALAFRPKLAAPMFIVMLATMLPQEELGGPIIFSYGAIAVSAYRVSTRNLAVMVGGFLIWQLMWIPLVSGLGSAQLWAYFPLTLLITTPGLAIKVLHDRAVRVEEIQRLVERNAAQAAAEQRAELARELHDVVTHGLTMIAVQANVGRITADSGAQDHALAEIGAMARSSLDDLRRLLKTMRAEEVAAYAAPALAGSVQPSPATIDLAQSVANTQRRLSGLGCPTTVSTSGNLDATPNGLRSTLQRLLQEGSTNVVKHSGANTQCEISLDVSGHNIELVIKNLMTPGKPRLPVSGTGLAGLRERVSRLGGTLDAGPRNGWWCVRAVLPFKERERLP